jgi:hypothetical protein
MPLSEPHPREFLTGRTITCNGYLRDDGLVEIEGRLVDVRGYPTPFNGWRDTVPTGQPVHEMWVRIAFDDTLTIRFAECATDSAPYPTCREITPNVGRLVGLTIVGGFKKQARARIGGTEGCTHVLALIDAMSSVAVHALAGSRRSQGRDTMLGTYGTRDPTRHPLVDSCHSYAADSEIVQKLWPDSYRPKGRDPAA